MIDPSSLFAGGAVIGVLTALWSKIKLMASKLNSVFIVSVSVGSYPVATSLKYYIISNFKSSRFTKVFIGSRTEYVRPVKRTMNVAFELIPSEPTVWWYKKRPILISNKDDFMRITYIRGTFNYRKLVQASLEKMNSYCIEESKSEPRFFILKESGSLGENSKDGFASRSNTSSAEKTSEPTGEYGVSSKYSGTPIKWTVDDLGLPKTDSSMDTLALSGEILDAVEEAKRWKRSEQWFKDRNIPWKRGWMLWGIPGTGKTAFVRALAQVLNIPIVVFNLATMSNNDFMKSWERAVNYLPAIFLFEDLDTVFEGRINKCSTSISKGVSFDIFINTLDGIDTTDGIFLIITTNDLKSIDPAIGTVGDGVSTRPGRIDKTLEFKRLDYSGRMKIAQRIFKDIDHYHWKTLLDDGKNDTGAQFQFRCSMLASKLWEDMKYE